MATPQQFEAALAAIRKGPLRRAVLERLATLRQGFASERSTTPADYTPRSAT
jgi:hypothetical protein